VIQNMAAMEGSTHHERSSAVSSVASFQKSSSKKAQKRKGNPLLDDSTVQMLSEGNK
jgi:hypothetical protein